MNDRLSFRLVLPFDLNFEVSPPNDLSENPAKCPILLLSPYSMSDWLPYVGEFSTLKRSQIFALLYPFLCMPNPLPFSKPSSLLVFILQMGNSVVFKSCLVRILWEELVAPL